VQHNGLGERITVLRGKMETVELPTKVDILISEWMGYFLLFERMLDSVLFARDRWLVPNGLILPNTASLYLAAVEDFELEAKRFAWWDEVYGFDLSPVGDYCRTEPLIDTVDPECFVSDTTRVLFLDIPTVTASEQDFGRNFELVVTRTETMHAVVAWFDVTFGGVEETGFSTGPQGRTTHWKQTIFYLPRALKVRKGERLKGRIEVHQDSVRPRSLRIRLEIKGASGKRESSYFL
jgi:protein arginine N-methyltransferase 1